MKDLKPKNEITIKNPSLVYSRKEKRELNILKLIVAICLLFVCASTFFNAYFEITTVEGQSMYPTINRQGTEFISAPIEKSDKAYYVLTNNVKKGDLIIALHGSIPVIKRLIATSGDTVEVFFENNIYGIKINGIILNEPYIYSNNGMSITYQNFLALKTYNVSTHLQDFSSCFNGNVLTIPENCVFYLGDNRGNSTDCSVYGPNTVNNIIAKVAFTVPYGQTLVQTLWINFCKLLNI